MPIEDALSDIGAALSGQRPTAPSAQAPPSGVDAALADLAKPVEQLRAETAPPAKAGGFTRNLGAGVNEFIAGGLGAPVDAATWLLNKSGAAFGGKLPIQNPFGGSESIKSLMGMVGADPRQVGQNNWQDTAARTVGSDAMAMVAPYMGARAAIARGFGAAVPTASGAVSSAPATIPETAVQMFGSLAPVNAGLARTALGAAGNAAIGAGGSVAGQGMEAMLPEGSPYRPLANFGGQMLGGGLVAGGMGLGKAGINYAGDQLRESLGPMFENYRKGIVGEKLRTNATDPYAAAQALDAANPQLVPGSKPTTYQLSGDQGLGQLERAQRTAQPAPFLERAAEQNAARVGQLEGLAPENAAPTAVRDTLKQQLDQVIQEGDANVARAQQNAQQAFEQSGGRMTPEEMGALQRDQLEAAKAATKKRESALWKAIDPEGKITINARPVGQEAGRILSEIPKTAKPPEGEEAAVFGLARLAGTAQPFQDFTALRGRLLQAIRDERINGQTPALRRMQQLRSSMDDTISNAAENAAQAEAGRAAAPTETMTARLAQSAQNWYEAQNAAARAGGDVGAGAGGNAGAGSQAISRMAGATGEAGGQPGGSAGGAGVQGAPSLANFDAEAAARYREAANATRERAATYNNQIVGPALQERGSEYRLLESRVPERFMSSTEGARAFIDAGGKPETLHDSLVMDLRRAATKPDGTLDTLKYQTWLNRRTDALALFPDLKTRLANVAGAQESVDGFAAGARQQRLAFEQSAARHFLNAEPMQAVRSALSGKTPVADMGQLRAMVSADPAGKAGLQRAVADYIVANFIGNTEAGTTGINGLKSDAFQTFLKRNGPAISNVFTPDQMKAMTDVAADLARSNRSIAGSKLPGQSNTAQDILAQDKLSVLKRYLGQGVISAAGGLGGYLVGGIHGALEGAGGAAVGKEMLHRMRAAGIERTGELLTEALLNPELARTLMMRASVGNRPIIAQRLGSQLGTLLAVSGTRAAVPTGASAP